MGLFSKKPQAPVVVVEPDDLRLEDQVETDVPGLTLKMPRDGLKVDLDIVGESFRQNEVKAVAQASNGDWFDIYLMPENGNPYDKNAVRVMVGRHHVGYVSKESAKKWRKEHASALKRGELLGGQAKCFSRDGQSFGVFGHVWMPKTAPKQVRQLEAQEVPLGTLALARSKLHELEMADDPTTVIKLKSLTKQAAKACEPLKQHCLWITTNATDQDLREAWAELEDRISEVDSALDEAIHAEEPEDVDILGVIGEVHAALEEALQASANSRSNQQST